MTSRLWREALAVASLEIKAIFFSVRSILLMVIYGGAAAGAGTFHLWAGRKIEEQQLAANPALAALDRKAMLTEMMKSEEFRKQVEPVVQKLGGERLLDAVVEGRIPWAIVTVLLLSTFVLPALVVLVGHDRISDDLSSKYCRFVLQRVHRGSYLAGKIAGLFAVVLGEVVLVHLILLAIGAAQPDLELGAVLGALPGVWLGMALFVLAYAAFTISFSVLITPPFAALAISLVALTGLWFLSLVTPLHDVWMGTWDMALWVLDPAAIAVFLAHTLLFGALGWYLLARRDV